MKVLEQNPERQGRHRFASPHLYLNQKKWDEAQEVVREARRDRSQQQADAYYSLGFIAWSKWYPVYGTARANLGMKQEDPGPIKDKKVKEELKAQVRPGDRRRPAVPRQGPPDRSGVR